MEKLITFSIAAYNVQEYLEKCLDSFIDENSMGKIEVIIVNDGSKDRTSDIAQKYCDKYPNTFKLVNKENGGHGSTINTAIRLATGKYFRPIDGDDWIETKNLQVLLSFLNLDADMILCPFKEIYEKSNTTKECGFDYLPQNTLFTFDSICWKSDIFFHHMIYKTEILKKNNIFVSEKVFYEDTEYSLFPLPFIESVIYIPLVLYCYRLGRIGQSVSEESKLKHVADAEKILFNCFSFSQKYTSDNRMNNYFKLRIRSPFKFYYDITRLKLFKKNKLYKKNKTRLFSCLKKTNKDYFNFYMNDIKKQRIRKTFLFRGLRKLYKIIKNVFD